METPKEEIKYVTLVRAYPLDTCDAENVGVTIDVSIEDFVFNDIQGVKKRGSSDKPTIVYPWTKNAKLEVRKPEKKGAMVKKDKFEAEINTLVADEIKVLEDRGYGMNRK